MLINSSTLEIIFQGLKSTFDQAFELSTPMWEKVAMSVSSGTEEEIYPWLGVAPGMREWLGDRVIKSLGTHKYTIKNKDWEQTVGVERNRLADDSFGVYTPLVRTMGEAAALHRDELVYGLLNDGRDATSLGYDGAPFFSAAHPHEELGTVSNLDSGGAGPYWYLADLTSMAMKPLILQMRKEPEFVSLTSLTDANVFFNKQFIMGPDARYNAGYGLWQKVYASNQTLNPANFQAAWEAMISLTADNGKPLNIQPMALVVPTTLLWPAKELIEPALVGNGTGGNTNIHQNSVEIIMSKHLDQV